MKQELSKVDVGDRVTVTKINDRGDIIGRTPLKYVVAAKCNHNSRNGQWVCATHEMKFSNQFCKDTHINTGQHQLAWFCFDCNNLQVP
jgi:hypothetical protein